MKMKPTDHNYTDDIICPYCGHVQKDAWEIVGSKENGNTDCDSCDQPYAWTVHRSQSYSTRIKEAPKMVEGEK